MLRIVPAADYHADVARVSGSMLDKFIEDRRDAQAMVEGRHEHEQSEEMALGSYVHAHVLEPLEVAGRYAFAPTRGEDGLACDAHKVVDRRTTKGKEVWAEFMRGVAARGQTVILPEQDEIRIAMVAALELHDEASHLLWSGGGQSERVLHWDDSTTGAAMRARLDRVFPADDVIVELKTDRDIRPDRNSNTWRWYDRGYHRKAALYLDAWYAVSGRNARLAFVFVENNLRPRVCVRWLEVDSPATEVGRIEYTEALGKLLRCRETNDWREEWERGSTAFEVPGPILHRHEVGLDDDVKVGGERLFR
jgi:hypothetical protein